MLFGPRSICSRVMCPELVGDLEGSEALRTGELGREGEAVATRAARQGGGGAEVEGRAGGPGGRARRTGGSQRHERVLLIFPAASGSELAPVLPPACAGAAGCRGVVGPFPLPLWMSRIRLSARHGSIRDRRATRHVTAPGAAAGHRAATLRTPRRCRWALGGWRCAAPSPPRIRSEDAHLRGGRRTRAPRRGRRGAAGRAGRVRRRRGRPPSGPRRGGPHPAGLGDHGGPARRAREPVAVRRGAGGGARGRAGRERRGHHGARRLREGARPRGSRSSPCTPAGRRARRCSTG